jgi:hypothetical protein
MTNQPIGRYDHFAALGRAGAAHDVDALMHALHAHDDFATSRLVDFALGLVDTREGTTRLRHYLFHGAPVQRNYAALYFKRRGRVALLEEAVAQGKIDATQAFSR